MTGRSLHYQVREQLSQLLPAEKQGISREEVLNGPRLKVTRELEREVYQLGSAFRRAEGQSHEASIDLARARLPLAHVDVAAWRDVIADRQRCFNSLVALIEPALREPEHFPATNELLSANKYIPADTRIRRTICNLDLVPDRELRKLIVERESRQQANHSHIKTIFPELKKEIMQGLTSLHSQLKLRNLELPLGDIQKRLDAVHLEVFDPLLSKSHSDIAFCSLFSHAVFLSDDLYADDYKPILRHELLHAASGLAPLIAQPGAAERGTGPLAEAMRGSFTWERYGLSAYDGKDESYTWLNEGVTEFLNQVIGQTPSHDDVTISGWSRMAGVIAKLAERIDISPLLNTYFSDASLHDPTLIANKRQLEVSISRVYGRSLFEELDKAWTESNSQATVCDLYDQRFGRRSWRERLGSLFGSVAGFFANRDAAAAR